MSSRKGLAVVAAAAALLLSSCSQNAPGVAADVDGTRITDEQVDDFAQVLCALNPGGGENGGNPTRAVRTQALQLILGMTIAGKIADLGTADQAQISDALAQAAASRELVPADLRGVFDDAVREYARSELALGELGKDSLIDQGQAKPDQAAAYSEGERLRTEYAKSADITVDPRFGTFKDGVLTPTSGSLSVPVSKAAKQAASSSPGDGATDLPASQTCG